MGRMKEYNGKQSVEFVERDGKYYVEFDDMPSVLFVSYDGNGSMDQFFFNGVFAANQRKVTIHSEVGAITTYTGEYYGIALEDNDGD